LLEPTLAERQLNRALLGRQLLLERVDLSLPRALERVGGLQTQYAPTGYIGLWSRVAGFERNQLTKALERGSVVQGTLMRATIHMVSRRDYPLLAAGVRITSPYFSHCCCSSPHAAEIWAPLVSTTLCADAADENRGMRPSTSVG
jgi:winged helix DNA-binding protein